MVRAVDDVPFELPRGKVIGLVGESGSGKTTIGRMVAQLIEPTSGSVRFDGLETTRLPAGSCARFTARTAAQRSGMSPRPGDEASSVRV